MARRLRHRWNDSRQSAAHSRPDRPRVRPACPRKPVEALPNRDRPEFLLVNAWPHATRHRRDTQPPCRTRRNELIVATSPTPCPAISVDARRVIKV